jgi:hypothetical protein
MLQAAPMPYDIEFVKENMRCVRACLRCRAATAQVKAENLLVVEKPFESIKPGFLSERHPLVLGVPIRLATVLIIAAVPCPCAAVRQPARDRLLL